MRQIIKACLLALPVFYAAQCGTAGTISLGTNVEMFVDEFLVAEKHGVELQLQNPVRREIVLETDRPWEGRDSAYFTVFQDGNKVRMYYRGAVPNDTSDQQVCCYAESADGIHFTRPNLGLVEFEGSRSNNIVYRGIEAHNFAPFIDTNPSATAADRYKSVGGVAGKLFGFASADGFQWHKLRDKPISTRGTFDSLNVAFWDETIGAYRCYSRYFSERGYKGFREIQSSVSTNFVDWGEQHPNRYGVNNTTGEVPREHLYTSATTPCPGLPQTLLAFPKRFVPERKKFSDYKSPGVSDAVFMSSRNGVDWERRFLEAWVRPGPDPRNWTQRSNMTARGIVETSPTEFSMYISEHYGWPDHRLRRLTIRRNGFVSMQAGAKGGEFTTKPFECLGERIVLNYATSAVGSVVVEAQSEDGQALPGYSLKDMEPLFGDEIAAKLTWKGGANTASLKHKTIRLKFFLRDADVFAISSQ